MFLSTIESHKIYQSATYNQNLAKKLYIKYVYKGSNENELEILYGYMIELINTATTTEELDYLESEINRLISEKKLSNKEYNYLINEVDKKRKEI